MVCWNGVHNECVIKIVLGTGDGLVERGTMSGAISNYTGYRGWFGGTGYCMIGVIRNFTGYRRWFIVTG